MSEEEKKAIEFAKNLIKTIEENLMLFDEAIMLKAGTTTHNNLQILINLIQSQQKEIEILTKTNKSYKGMITKKDKIINEMTKALKQDDIRSVKEIKQYFEKKVEGK